MKCYVHSETDAVAGCKHCIKGLCRECAVETPGGMACRGRCEEELASIRAMLDRSQSNMGRADAALAFSRQATRLGCGLLAGIGLPMAAFGLWMESHVVVGMGGLLFFAGVAGWLAIRKSLERMAG